MILSFIFLLLTLVCTINRTEPFSLWLSCEIHTFKMEPFFYTLSLFDVYSIVITLYHIPIGRFVTDTIKSFIGIGFFFLRHQIYIIKIVAETYKTFFLFILFLRVISYYYITKNPSFYLGNDTLFQCRYQISFLLKKLILLELLPAVCT
jgi:hypothetical protein